MWRLLQLVDSGYPTGGFVHSGGLEATLALGEMTDIGAFVLEAAWQAGHGALPLVRRAHAEPDALAAIDAAADAFLVAEPGNRASRAQGRAFLATSVRAFGLGDLAARARDLAGHLAPLQGAVGAALGMCEADILAVALFSQVRAVVSAAVRLGQLGPIEAQALLAAVPFDRILAAVPPEPIQTAPLVDLCGALHGRLYSRLFQS
jgi:urease accessory protein